MSYEYTNYNTYSNALNSAMQSTAIQDTQLLTENEALAQYIQTHNLSVSTSAQQQSAFNSFIGSSQMWWQGDFTIGSMSLPKLAVFGGLVILLMLNK